MLVKKEHMRMSLKITHVLYELIVRLDMMEFQMKRCERKINSIYDNLRNDGPLID